MPRLVPEPNFQLLWAGQASVGPGELPGDTFVAHSPAHCLPSSSSSLAGEDHFVLGNLISNLKSGLGLFFLQLWTMGMLVAGCICCSYCRSDLEHERELRNARSLSVFSRYYNYNILWPRVPGNKEIALISVYRALSCIPFLPRSASLRLTLEPQPLIIRR